MDCLRIALILSLIHYNGTVSFDDITKTLQSVQDMLKKLEDAEDRTDTKVTDNIELKEDLKKYIDIQIRRRAEMHLNAERILQALRIEKRLRKQLQNKVISTEKSLMGKQQEIDALQNDLNGLRKDVTGFKRQCDGLVNRYSNQMQTAIQQSNDNMRRYIDKVVDKCDMGVENLNKSIVDTLDNSKTQLTKIIASISSKVVEKIPEKIAFSAVIKTSYADLTPWQVLVFSGILLNVGNAYSDTTGKFTAPVGGVYVFDVHITGRHNAGLEIALQKNTQNILFLYVKGQSHGTSTGAVTVHLHLGDVVTVVKHGAYGDRPFYVHNDFSSFTGFLLFEL